MSTETTSPPTVRYASVTFDCPDPAELVWRVQLDPAGHPFCITTLG
jgi:hypothetical protein